MEAVKEVVVSNLYVHFGLCTSFHRIWHMQDHPSPMHGKAFCPAIARPVSSSLLLGLQMRQLSVLWCHDAPAYWQLNLNTLTLAQTFISAKTRPGRKFLHTHQVLRVRFPRKRWVDAIEPRDALAQHCAWEHWCTDR